jgi:hypothetical protein
MINIQRGCLLKIKKERKMNEISGTEYIEHKVFGQIAGYIDFYNTLSFSIMGWISQGTKGLNIDTYVYSSIQGTLESIRDILLKGRINDSYTLLRKYYDSTIINVYSNLYLSDHFSIDNFIVTQIENWRKGIEKIPEYRVMSKYIKDSSKLQAITELLNADKKYKKIRDRCNDHTHYNFYHNLLLNDNKIFLQNRLESLDIFSCDLEDIFIQHFAYIFYLNEHYMMSSDYIDSLDLGLTPENDSQNFVAPFVQNIFDKVIKIKRPDLANEIKNKTSMRLD